MQLNTHQIPSIKFIGQTANIKPIAPQQAAVNEFFEGYGSDTLKEYGQTMLDLLSVLKSHKLLSSTFEENITSKFNSLYRLISDLAPVPVQQAAVNEFFEGYGSDTLKEYGQTMFDLLTVVKSNKVLSEGFEENITSKINSLYRLISNLSPVPGE